MLALDEGKVDMKAQASLHISSASQEHLLLDDNLPKIVSYPPGRINIVRFFFEDPFFNVSCFFFLILLNNRRWWE